MHAHTQDPPVAGGWNPRQSRPSRARHTLRIVTALRVCPHLFFQAVPRKEGWGWKEPIQSVVSAEEAPLPAPACRHSENLRPTSPAGPPVDVGMRIDVASIDMVSEVNMVSGLRTGSVARLTQIRKGPVCLPSAFHWRSSRPGPGSPTPRALPTRTHTHTPSCPWFVFWTHTRAGYCGVPKETCTHYSGNDGWLAAADPAGRSLRVTLAGFPPGVPRRRAPSAGGRAACTRFSDRGPQPPSRRGRPAVSGARELGQTQHRHQACRHTARCQSVPSLLLGSSTPCGRSNRLR